MLNLIFNLFYQNQNHSRTSQLKSTKMKLTITMQSLQSPEEIAMDRRNFFLLQMKLNHQENDSTQILIKYFQYLHLSNCFFSCYAF